MCMLYNLYNLYYYLYYLCPYYLRWDLGISVEGEHAAHTRPGDHETSYRHSTKCVLEVKQGQDMCMLHNLYNLYYMHFLYYCTRTTFVWTSASSGTVLFSRKKAKPCRREGRVRRCDALQNVKQEQLAQKNCGKRRREHRHERVSPSAAMPRKNLSNIIYPTVVLIVVGVPYLNESQADLESKSATSCTHDA